MECIEIKGGHPLTGEVRIQGSKNAALPILAASVLHRGTTILHNCPQISDVMYMVEILREMGCVVSWENHTVLIDSRELKKFRISEEFGKRMRSSVIFLGSLLGRSGYVKIPYPGGCTIGERPIDLHIDALRKMNARIEEEDGLLKARTDRLHGICYTLRFPSVGATENMILAGVLAEGTTIIKNSAREPEIVSLCQFLCQKGAKIKGAGTETITVEGVGELFDSEYTLSADRIVGGTYLMAIVATRGNGFLYGMPTEQMENVLCTAAQMGAEITVGREGVHVDARKAENPVKILWTRPYPGFPTDLQSPTMTVLCVAKGESRMVEGIFESRFKNVEELRKMGAKISLNGQEARIQGIPKLYGADVKASDLRGGAALVIAGATAEGITHIADVHYIRRGYENICEDFRQMGAAVKLL